MNKSMIMVIVGIIFVSYLGTTVISASAISKNISDGDENSKSFLGTIEVWLFTQEERCPIPIKDALVILKRNDGLTQRIGITEVGGYKRFDNLPFGEYTIKTMKTGYEVGSANVTITSEEPCYFAGIRVDGVEDTIKQKSLSWTGIQPKLFFVLEKLGGKMDLLLNLRY